MKFQKLATLVTLFLLLLAQGCATPGSSGSRTLKEVDMDVSGAMTRFRNGVAAGAVTLAERQQVNSAYAGYQAAFHEALQAAGDNRDAPAPDNVKALATQVIAAISAIPF
jgi:hypothetical protein